MVVSDRAEGALASWLDTGAWRSSDVGVPVLVYVSAIPPRWRGECAVLVHEAGGDLAVGRHINSSAHSHVEAWR